MKSSKYTSKLLITVILLTAVNIFAQDTTQSLAFKKNRPQRPNVFYQPDLSYQIWQQFNLIKEANAGNALAQHELGLRYLLGDGMKADTTLGAYWIKKAADQKLAAAAFNYGILLINGWGVEWNPFQAYDFFLLAAKDGMPEAEYVVGILYTDNLILKRDLNTAYIWVKKASDAGYDPAKKTLTNLSKKVDTKSLDSTLTTSKNNKYANSDSLDKINKKNNPIGSTLGLAFIDFDTLSDSTVKIENKTLLEDLTLIGSDSLNKSIYTKKTGGGNIEDSTLSFDSLDLSLVLKFAENGCPEALTLLGKFYQDGMYYKKDLITSAVYYIRAIRLDSPRAPSLLYDMIKQDIFYNLMKDRASKNNPEAMYVWHGLHTLGFDHSIASEDALNLLTKSADANYLPALIELGVSYYSGKIVKENKLKALSIWKDAEKEGSGEASVRIETALLFSSNERSSDNIHSFEILKNASENGSILALVSLAYCYEEGKGTKPDIAEAVKSYRLAAQRGSQYAFKELQRLYDSVRPADAAFQLN